jgi:hypothetical protein
MPTSPPQTRNCGTMPVHEQLLRTDERYARARIASENRSWLARTARSPVGRAGITVIPVVVHVVWKTNDENIDDEQVKSQIAVLNQDFRMKNADLGSIPPPFAALAADARVEFALATTDPAGDPTSGITRKKTTKASFSALADDVKHASTGGVDAWPADEYLNLWVCTLGGGLLGYAQFPGGPAQTDGVVLLNTGFGTTGTATGPFDLGRSATHEVGHWLNLRHIWGDDDGGCNGDDFVTDTPNAADHNFGKPAYPHITCGNGPNGDMFMNYMDYVDDDSMFLFTAGQVQRMQACLDGDRASIGHQKPAPGLMEPGLMAPVPGLQDKPIFLDHYSSSKFYDDILVHKNPFLDEIIVPPPWPPPWPHTGFGSPGPVPFVLATGHHAQPWAGPQPDGEPGARRGAEEQLGRLQQVLFQYALADRAGQLSDADRAAGEQLWAEFERLAGGRPQTPGG